MSNKYFYSCVDCGKEFHTNEIMYLCPECAAKNTATTTQKGVLKTNYHYSEIILKYNTSNLFDRLKKDNYLDLLPINNPENFPVLRVGNTPVYKLSNIEKSSVEHQVFIKDDSQNPTFSFKDRASYLVSAFAKENNINTIIAASTGNAGSSLAGICASQNQKAIVFVPASAPKAKLTQILMYGATIVPVDGTYDNAFDLSIEVTQKYDLYNRNTAYNPLTIEGKKTVSFEIYDFFKNDLPDVIFVPVGDGVIISGVYKGFEDLLKLKIIDKIPKIIAVQAEGSSNLVNNLNREDFEFLPSKTIADSISVDIPRNFNMARNYLRDYKGKGMIVTDYEIINASKVISKNSGIFPEPAAATAYAGYLKYLKDSCIENNSKILILLTGSGLKDLNAVQSAISIPKPIKPEFSQIEKFLSL